jgi:endoglucanase
VRAGLLPVLVAALLLVPSSDAVGAGGAPAQAPVALPGVSVQGPQLLLNGVPWSPRGVQIVGLVAPDDALSGKYIDAHAHFGAAELRQAVADGADTVRFQVSEFGLDPDNTLYSPAYVQEIESAVATARSLGLTAIISVQAEPPAGESPRCPLPDAGTENVWEELAPLFADDPGVIFELYNEPAIHATASGWQLWLNGGPVSQANGFSCEAVGMQTLIDVIRDEDADNVIIVPGLNGEQTLAGMPALVDPADSVDPQLAYGIHYPSPTGAIPEWNREFGALSDRVPVIVTEWDENSTASCASDAPTMSPFLLDYLASKQIGIVGFAFDLPGTIIADWSYTPTSYDDFPCGTPGGGPGQLLFGEFAGMAQAQSPAGVTAWILGAHLLQDVDALAPSIARHLFDTPRTFVTGASAASLNQLSVPAALPTVSFTSEAALADAVGSGSLPGGTRAVIFDDEDSKLTPRAEQLHPARFYSRAAQVAHRAGLLLIASPATNLVAAIAPRTPNSRQYAEFLKLRIAAAAARYADVFEIQAQVAAMDQSTYASFVQLAGAQAAAAHPGVELLGEITTNNAQGTKQAAKSLENAVLATRSFVSGYWLTDPGPGEQCSSCSASPGVATTFLRELSSSGN